MSGRGDLEFPDPSRRSTGVIPELIGVLQKPSNRNFARRQACAILDNPFGKALAPMLIARMSSTRLDTGDSLDGSRGNTQFRIQDALCIAIRGTPSPRFQTHARCYPAGLEAHRNPS